MVAALETAGVARKEIDPNQIVPVVKDRPWLSEVRKAMAGKGDVKENVFDDLNSDLVVVYAEDGPTNIRYLSPADLEHARIPHSELRRLAS